MVRQLCPGFAGIEPFFGAAPRGLSKRLPFGRTRQKPQGGREQVGFCNFIDLTRWDDEGRLWLRRKYFFGAANVGRNNCFARRGALEENAPEWLLPRGMDNKIDLGQDVWNVLPRSQEVDMPATGGRRRPFVQGRLQTHGLLLFRRTLSDDKEVHVLPHCQHAPRKLDEDVRPLSLPYLPDGHDEERRLLDFQFLQDASSAMTAC
jgi:hypothetical protein